MGARRGDMLRRLPTEVRIKNQHERLVFKVVFVNKTTSEWKEMAASLTLGQILVALIESWDSDWPLSTEGFEELEDLHPGICDAFLTAFHRTRAVELEGN